MKIGDKVKVEGYGGTFEIVWVYTECVKPFYALARNYSTYLLETLKTEDDLTFIPPEQLIHDKVADIYSNYMGRDVIIALTKILLQRIPPDEALDMLNNIEEYME